MITYEVDEKKLRFWKELYEKNLFIISSITYALCV